MDENDQFLQDVLRSLNTGVAVVDPDDWSVMFENACFFKWFEPDGEEVDTIEARMPKFDIAEAKASIKEGKTYSFETQSGKGARAKTIEVDARPVAHGDRQFLFVECQDLTKVKEAEYLLDSYSKLAEKNARELRREKERAEKLLLNIMPKAVYEEMKDFGSVTPQRFDEASVLMLDFVGFTDMAISRDPTALIGELNDIFTAFDRIVELFDCERIKTIGDAYMAVSGVPEQTPDHAQNAARAALRIRRYLERRNSSHPEQWECRIGIHSGPVIGSVVGIQKYVYDIFGPGVNLATRMEALSEAMQISVTEATRNLIEETFLCSERGEIEVKGFGKIPVYTLEAELA